MASGPHCSRATYLLGGNKRESMRAVQPVVVVRARSFEIRLVLVDVDLAGAVAHFECRIGTARRCLKGFASTIQLIAHMCLLFYLVPKQKKEENILRVCPSF